MNVVRAEAGSDAKRQQVKPCYVLFLDDEQAVLDGLARQLRDPPEPWRFGFFQNPSEALLEVARCHPDIVVTDMHMPGMRGDEWLKQVQSIAPDAIRIVLSGRDDRATTLAALNNGHVFHYLSKPCLRGELLRVLDMARRQSQLMSAERDVLRRQLEQAERAATLGQFSAGIVHDLNNLIGVVLNAADPGVGLPAAEALELIRANARRMRELTAELVSYYRGSATDEACSAEIVPVVKSCQRLLGPALPRGVELRAEIPEGLPAVLARPSELKQVVTNLVLNARDAMRQGGQVLVRAGLPQGAGNEGTVCLSVADQGCGMDEAVRRRLFEPFFTTKAEGQGTGLGLALVKQIVERYHGHIEVDSEPGAGTTFRIYLRLAAESAGKAR